MDPQAKIYVSGGNTLLGAALLRTLAQRGYRRLAGAPPHEPDPTDARAIDEFFARERPDYVLIAAGKSGGIRANVVRPAELMLDNLLVASHVIAAAARHGVRKLLYLASSCSYPRLAPQPMRVETLLTGPLEPTNEPYALAKLAGIKLCQAYRRQYGEPFIVGIPANAFGPGDDFDLQEAHVVPALIARMHAAKESAAPSTTVWGTGAARREFVYCDDLAEACLFVMEHYDDELPINLGGGANVSIRELAEAIRQTVGYRGELLFDASQPDGMPLKALDCEPLERLGWRPATPFHQALARTYEWHLRQLQEATIHA